MANTFTGFSNDEILASVGIRRQDVPARVEVTNKGGAATPSPTPAVSAEKDEDEEEKTLWERTLEKLGFVGEKFASGAAEGTEGVVNQAGYTGQMAQRGQAIPNMAWAQAFGDIFNIDKLQRVSEQEQATAKDEANKPIETVANFGDNYSAKVEEKYADAYIGKGWRIAGDVAQGLGGLVPAVAANIIAPGSGLAVMTTGAIGNATQEAKKSGADDATAMAYGVAVGAVEAVTEKLLGGMGGLFGKGALDDVAKGFISNRIKSGAVRGGLNTLVSAFGEGFEEFIAEYGSALANKLTVNTDTRNMSETTKDALYNALIGGVVGSIANIGDSINAGKPIDPKEAAEMAAEEAATEIKNAMPTQGEISPSEGVSAQPTTGAANIENVGRANPGDPGLESGEVRAERDANGNVTVVIDADILAGKPRTEWRKAVSNEIQRLFENGIKLPRGTIFSNKKGRGEFTNGSYTKMLERTDPAMYEDKMRMASGADMLLQNAENVTPESPAHDRNDDIVSFNRGSIRVRVKGAGYIGDLLTAIYSDGKETFFDINNLARNENEATPERYAAGNADGFSQTGAASTDNVTQRKPEVKDIYGKSVGAATPELGEMVPTQNKAITQNINLGEESIAANQPAPHERISEQLSLARAGAMLYTDSEGNVVNFDETLNDLMNKEGAWTGVESDAVQLLLKEAERRGDAAAVKRIAERMAKEGTDLGQALQSRQKWISAEPASRLAAMYQTVAKFAEKHKAVKGGKIEIPDFLAKAYLEAGTEQTRNEIIGDIQEYVAQQSRSSLMEKWTALRYTNMLGNFKTQIRNIAGNTTMLLTTRAKDEVGALAEAIYGKERTKSAFVGKEWMRAAKADYANAKKQIMSYGKYTDENFKGDFAEGIEDKRKILPVGLEQYRKATNWAMETGDTIFSKAAYSRALAGFLKANGVAPEQLAAGTVDSALMEKARAYAVKQAQEATFRDSNAFSDWASTLLRTEDTPEAIKVLGEGLMPFRRTPANVLTRAVEYSPLGVANTAVKVHKARKGDGDVTASDVIDSLAKAITGTGLVILGYLLSDMGLLRASGDEEDEGIDALMGRQDWSLVIPGVGSYTFDWAAPASLIMFTGAALQEMTSDEGLTFSDLEGALTSLTEPLIQMSMLNGINDTLDSIKYSDNNLLQMAGQLAAGYLTQGLTNTMLGQIERSAEGVRMSTYTEADSPLPEWLQRTIGKASAKTPGWDYQQTEYLNEFGETESSGNAAQRILENFFSPGYWESAKEGESVYDFAQNVYDSLGVGAFPSAYAPKSISYDGTTHVLTQEQREAYQRTQGQTAKKLMEAAERSGAYDALGDDAKRDVVSELLSFAREQGKRDALDISGDMSEKEKAVAALSPSDMVSYFSLEAAANAMDKDGATNEEISTMQELIDAPISKSVAEIIMDGDFKKMYEADKAGISVRQFSVISANMDALTAPQGYTNKPNWQKYGVIADSNLDDGKKLEMVGVYGGESAYKNFSEAMGKGYSFDRVAEFYEAYNRKNADGTSKDTAGKKAAVLAAGFTETQYLALKKIFS